METGERTVLVAGGAGAVGEGIVGALLTAGARVVVPSRSAGRLEGLRDRFGGAGGLVTVVGDVGHPTGALAVRDRVADEVGALDAVIASVGGWWSGDPVVDLPVDTWRRLVDDRLTPHVVVARTFLPVVADRRGSSYTTINGSAGLEPVAGAGPQCVASAGLLMLTDVLAEEHRDAPVRINSLVLMTPVLTRARGDGPDHWLRADEVGRYAAHLVSAGSTASGERILLDRTGVEDVPP